jgi:hypothetical protein
VEELSGATEYEDSVHAAGVKEAKMGGKAF